MIGQAPVGGAIGDDEAVSQEHGVLRVADVVLFPAGRHHAERLERPAAQKLFQGVNGHAVMVVRKRIGMQDGAPRRSGRDAAFAFTGWETGATMLAALAAGPPAVGLRHTHLSIVPIGPVREAVGRLAQLTLKQAAMGTGRATQAVAKAARRFEMDGLSLLHDPSDIKYYHAFV